MGILDVLFGGRDKEISEVLKQGAIIIDVRTSQEFSMGNISDSINIPLDEINSKVEVIKAHKKPIVLCCASGSRSAMAAGILRRAGLEEVYNGRSWHTVQNLLNQ